MRKIMLAAAMAVFMASIALIVFSPEILSMIVTGIMTVIIGAGLIFGLFPALSIQRGLETGIEKIEEALYAETDSMWIAVVQMMPLFKQKQLDGMFQHYKERLDTQYKTGQMFGDIEDYINEESISICTWNTVVSQISGTLTGLGLLGTFVGLLTGISEIGFSSVDAALSSVQTLLNGIHTAFYTSIAGVILSILFNILCRIIWNMTSRQIAIFTDEFHKKVIPSVEEQMRYRNQKQMDVIIERLDRIPKTPAYSIGNQSALTDSNAQKNEAILMPQIISGMENGEFIFVLEPKYDINTKKVIAAEAFIRWMHPKLGMLSPAVFLPIAERNGYITKLDEHTWRSVCAQIHEWNEQGVPMLPISVNISKTDILAGDVVNKLTAFMDEYQIAPRMLDVEISANAFTDAGDITAHVIANLRKRGIKTILDGFNGNYMQYQAFNPDEIKFDVRGMDAKRDGSFIKDVFHQARQTGKQISAVGIETMEQVSLLRKCGCTTGQGYYFSRPVTQQDYKTLITGENN